MLMAEASKCAYRVRSGDMRYLQSNNDHNTNHKQHHESHDGPAAGEGNVIPVSADV